MSGGFVADGPVEVAAFRALALRGMLKLEAVGMRRRGPSALSIVRREFGVKARTAAAALPLFEALLRERGILAPKAG